MNPDSPIARASHAFGIHAGYHDIWGQYHALGEPTARAILGALGVDTSSDDALDAAAVRREHERWTRALPPAVIAHDDGPLRVEIAVPERDWTAPLEFSVRTESGEVHAVETRAAEHDAIEERHVDGEGLVRRVSVTLSIPVPLGYHRITLRVAGTTAESAFIVCPRRCRPVPRRRDGRRLWGAALQLYSLRSARNWGIGDFTDLAEAVGELARLGADVVGVNPIHALYPQRPAFASPYSPSSRRFSNPLYLDVEAVADFAECDAARAEVADSGFQQRLTELRAAALVDYEGVAALKWRVLEQLFEHFRVTHLDPGSERGAAFTRFCEEGGEALALHALYEAIAFVHGPAEWPGALTDPASDATRAFAREHAGLVDRQRYLQWQTTLQLDAAQRTARDAGMAIGLYLDLAVGSDSMGADTWGDPDGYARGISLGAPPDDFALQGQVWGLSPWPTPHLERTGYRTWREVLRANMRSAGALRIDHVAGLVRQFWVPSGGDAGDGAYLQFPFEALFSILALESERTGCVVIGEDLGTVPDEARESLHRYGVLSYRVLWFEKHWHGDHSFLSPGELPEQALVTVTTHDLPTLAGWWRERDLDIRDSLGLVADAETLDRLRAGRAEDRDRLVHALEREGLRPEGELVREHGLPNAALAAAIHRYAARSRSALLMVQMEDVFGALEQTNVPGTVTEQPNWRRKLDVGVEDWGGYEPLAALSAALAQERAND